MPTTEQQIESLVMRLGEQASPPHLAKNGVPFEVAFSLPAYEHLAYIVALGTLDGRSFESNSLSWKDQA